MGNYFGAAVRKALSPLVYADVVSCSLDAWGLLDSVDEDWARELPAHLWYYLQHSLPFLWFDAYYFWRIWCNKLFDRAVEKVQWEWSAVYPWPMRRHAPADAIADWFLQGRFEQTAIAVWIWENATKCLFFPMTYCPADLNNNSPRKPKDGRSAYRMVFLPFVRQTWYLLIYSFMISWLAEAALSPPTPFPHHLSLTLIIILFLFNVFIVFPRPHCSAHRLSEKT